MSSKWKSPGDALQRVPEAKMNSRCDTTFTSHVYPMSSDLQTRRLRHRFGLDEGKARLVAALLYGEGR